jgi:pimeloyl-ACP methyl ester carboxylesterase
MEKGMNQKGIRLYIALLVLFLGGCSADTPTPIPTSTAATTTVIPATAIPRETPRFEPTPCAFDAEQTPGYAVDCGFVVVPELHRNPTGPTIRLAVARFHSQASAPAPDPVIFLTGGPGGPGLISTFTANIAYNFTPTRDFIAFDQRGIGHSEPFLDCPELTEQTRLDSVQEMDASDEAAHGVAARFRCRDRLVRQGDNLAAYTTTESAADVNDIRAALGYQTVNLFGASYGTQLALAVVRDFPAIVRSVVLDSVKPPQSHSVEDLAPNAERALNLAFAGCAASGACREDVPTLQADFDDAVAQLNLHPIALPAVMLTGDRFSAQIVGLLKYPTGIATVPALVEAVKRGDDAYLRNTLGTYVASGLIGNSTGMSTSVVCTDMVPFESRDRTIAAAQQVLPGIRAGVLPLALSYFDLCAGWPTQPPDPRDHSAVASDLPTLILESADDPATPPAYGQMAAQSLSKSVYVETPGVGHTVMGTDCGRKMIAGFVADPTAKPDTACVASMGVSYASTATR